VRLKAAMAIRRNPVSNPTSRAPTALVSVTENQAFVKFVYGLADR
jgi:hypothetical protein